MKKATLIIILILFSVLVYAIPQILNQSQIDGIDADTVDLECQFEDLGQSHLYWKYGELQYIRNVSCYSITRLNSTHYKLIRPNHYLHFLVVDYINCRIEYNKTVCSDYFVDKMRKQHIREKLSIRDIIRGYQTPETPDIGDFEDTLEV